MAEILAIFSADGHRLGEKPRDQVHRDGDWHWLVFVWSARIDAAGQAKLLLQQRGRPDDPFYGNVDCPAAGHVEVDETHLQGARREFAEEVGVQLTPDDLYYLYQDKLEIATGLCRRAIQHFYFCRRPIDLLQARCSDEAVGFIEVGLEDFAALIDRRRAVVEGVGHFAEPQLRPVQIKAEALASYNPAIIANFRRSLSQIAQILSEDA